MQGRFWMLICRIIFAGDGFPYIRIHHCGKPRLFPLNSFNPLCAPKGKPFPTLQVKTSRLAEFSPPPAHDSSLRCDEAARPHRLAVKRLTVFPRRTRLAKGGLVVLLSFWGAVRCHGFGCMRLPDGASPPALSRI